MITYLIPSASTPIGLTGVSATSLPANAMPTVTNTGTPTAANLVFGIPAGAAGPTGPIGATGPAGPAGAAGASYTGTTRFKSGIPSSVTGTIAQTALAIQTIPSANLLPDTQIEITALFSCNSSANAKTFTISINDANTGLNGATGIYYSNTVTSGLTVCKTNLFIRDNISSFVGGPLNDTQGEGNSPGIPANSAIYITNINGNAGIDIVLSGTLNAASDIITLEAYCIEIKTY